MIALKQSFCRQGNDVQKVFLDAQKQQNDELWRANDGGIYEKKIQTHGMEGCMVLLPSTFISTSNSKVPLTVVVSMQGQAAVFKFVTVPILIL